MAQQRVSVYLRLRRLHEAGYLGRERQSDWSDYVYFLTEKGAEKSIEHGYLNRKFCVYKKSLLQIPHDIGLSECQLGLSQAFPEMECRRWRADLQKDFTGEVPDLFFDLKDGTGWTPFEYERLNPVSHDKLADYAKDFKRTYIVVQTERRAEMLLRSIENELPTSKLWFTDVLSFNKNVLGKIWWTPKNFRERQYSILKPEY